MYATMGYVTSDKIRQMLPILPLNCFVRPALERRSPSRAYRPPTSAPILVPIRESGPAILRGSNTHTSNMIDRYTVFL